MKIGILTFHYSANIGSVLQTWCVCRLLQQRFPDSRVEVIDLVPRYRRKADRSFVGRRFPFIRTDNICRYVALHRFVHHHLPLSARATHEDLDRQMAFVNAQHYDLVTTGSDTVWMHSRKLKGQLPSVYYLPEGINARKASVAASLDPLRDLTPFLENREVLKRTFDGYEMISVRDRMTERMLHAVGVTQVQRLADPTLICDFESEMKIAVRKHPPEKPQNVLVLLYDALLEEHISRRISAMDGLNVVSGRSMVPRSVAAGRADKAPTGPAASSEPDGASAGQRYITRIINACTGYDVLITDRYHLSLFAVKLSNTLVIHIENESKYPIPGGKGRDFMADIGMNGHGVRYEQEKEEEFGRNITRLIREYDAGIFRQREQRLQAFVREHHDVWKGLAAKLTP